MGTVARSHDGKWFAYGRTRTLGPFTFEKQAWRALREEGEE